MKHWVGCIKTEDKVIIYAFSKNGTRNEVKQEIKTHFEERYGYGHKLSIKLQSLTPSKIRPVWKIQDNEVKSL